MIKSFYPETWYTIEEIITGKAGILFVILDADLLRTNPAFIENQPKNDYVIKCDNGARAPEPFSLSGKT